MNDFAVIGLGNFGYNIAKKLIEKNKNVIVIDSDSQQINKIKDIAADSVIGDAKDKQMLEEFIDHTVDTVIISTGTKMFDSILAVHHLKELGVKNILVKAIDETHGQLLKIMGATEIIFPEKDIAEWWADRLAEPNLLERIPLTPDYAIVEYACPDIFTGKSIKNIQLRSKYKIMIIAIKDILKDEMILMPDADYKLKPDSILLLMGKKNDIGKMKLSL